MATKSLIVVFGTRPEAIKLGPIVAELRALGIAPTVLSTGQHWDLLQGTPAETDLAQSWSLNLPADSEPHRWVTRAIPVIQRTLQTWKTPVVVVQGDTASALAGARAAAGLGFPVAHIEAGVRSHDVEEPWPEEGFRREITHLATWHYAATPLNVDHLLSEGVDQQQVRLTGNPVVSALHRYADPSPRKHGNHLLLTMHRREWLQSVSLPTFIREVVEWCWRHSHLTLKWPVHPAVTARWPQDLPSSWPPNLLLLKPLPYQRMIEELSTCQGLATDSGGLVEESTTLGIPTAILRRSNDRPEAVEAGVARQFPDKSPPEALDWLVTQKPGTPTRIFGDRDAAARIARHLASLD